MSINPRFPDEVLLVTARDAAKLLCMSERTLWTLTHKREELGHIMLGRKKLYEVAELKRWIEARKTTGASTCPFPDRLGKAKQG